MFTRLARSSMPLVVVTGAAFATHSMNKKAASAAAAPTPAPVVPTPDPNLGLLSDLQGKWKGTGYNLIALPTKGGAVMFFRLKLSATQETIEFTNIGGPVANRGPNDDPVNNFGLTYLQKVNEVSEDGKTVTPIHIETGMFLAVPPSKTPSHPAGNFTRLSSIPHGDVILASGAMQNLRTIPGPFIVASPILPTFVDGTKPMNANVLGVYTMQAGKLPKNITAATFNNPNSLLIETNKGLTITSTSTFFMATDATAAAGGGGVVNIPFVTTNADVPKVNAIFWLEKCTDAKGNHFDQLQYTQTVMIRFQGIDWPHVSVATLRRA